jgi:hypothetical protein
VGLVLHLIAFSFLASALMIALGGVLETKHSIVLWRSKRVMARDLGAVSGIFDVRGAVHASTPLTAPITGRSCVQYTVVVERAHKGSDGDPDLITFVDAAPFSVDDGTGRVHIDLRMHRIPVTGASIVKKPMERLTQPLERLLALRLHKPGGLWCTGRDVVATEAALVDGTEASVVARKGKDGLIVPLHVTTGRPLVVAMQGLTRAGVAFIVSALLAGVWLWLK